MLIFSCCFCCFLPNLIFRPLYWIVNIRKSQFYFKGQRLQWGDTTGTHPLTLTHTMNPSPYKPRKFPYGAFGAGNPPVRQNKLNHDLLSKKKPPTPPHKVGGGCRRVEVCLTSTGEDMCACDKCKKRFRTHYPFKIETIMFFDSVETSTKNKITMHLCLPQMCCFGLLG